MPSDSTINKFLMKAKEASKMATYKHHHLGGVLVYGNKILATGYNTNKTNPRQWALNKYRKFSDFHAPNNGSCHCETSILLKTKFLDIDWNKATLYIYREHKNGQSALSMPCPGCFVGLQERGVGTVIFTNGKKNKYTIWKLINNEYEEIERNDK